MKYQLLILAAPEMNDSSKRFSRTKYESAIKRQNSLFSSPHFVLAAIRQKLLPVGETIDLGNSIITIDIQRKTQGALATVGLCLDYLNVDDPIVITPFDGNLEISMDSFLDEMLTSNSDIGIVAFKSSNPNYSFVRIASGEVIEIAEKKVISGLATSGTFFFKNKLVLLRCIEWALVNNVQTASKFFIAPSINAVIMNRAKIGIFEISEDNYNRLDLESLWEKNE